MFFLRWWWEMNKYKTLLNFKWCVRKHLPSLLNKLKTKQNIRSKNVQTWDIWQYRVGTWQRANDQGEHYECPCSLFGKSLQLSQKEEETWRELVNVLELRKWTWQEFAWDKYQRGETAEICSLQLNSHFCMPVRLGEKKPRERRNR